MGHGTYFPSFGPKQAFVLTSVVSGGYRFGRQAVSGAGWDASGQCPRPGVGEGRWYLAVWVHAGPDALTDSRAGTSSCM